MNAPACRGFSLLEAIVGVAIATAFLGAIALFTTNIGESRARLARASREIECVEVAFSALESACATAIVGGGPVGPGIVGNETSLRIQRSGVGLGNDGQPIFGELSMTSLSFEAGSGRIALKRGGSINMLSAPVRALRIRYLAEDGWQDAFDSADSGAFPVGIEVSIWFARGEGGSADDAASDSFDPSVESDALPDRSRFFRVMGAPRVDPLAIRRIEKDRER